MKKVLFIYNPHSGKGEFKAELSDVIDLIGIAGYDVVVYPTQSYMDAYKKVVSFTEDYERVICAGGDGTLDEVVTGMMKREHKIPIGYLPAGTTNDFASSLHIPKGFMKAADNAVHGMEMPCDIGQFNDDVFVYIAAFGLFTDVSYQTRQEMKNLLGHMAYVLEGMTRIFDVPSYKVKITHDGEVIEDEFILGMVTNSRSVGGFRHLIGRNVVFDDGLFEVTMIRTPKTMVDLQMIISSLVSGQMDSEYMYSFKTKELSFESEEEIPWTLDGEFGGNHDMVRIKNCQKALSIMVPERTKSVKEKPGEDAQ